MNLSNLSRSNDKDTFSDEAGKFLKLLFSLHFYNLAPRTTHLEGTSCCLQSEVRLHPLNTLTLTWRSVDTMGSNLSSFYTSTVWSLGRTSCSVYNLRFSLPTLLQSGASDNTWKQPAVSLQSEVPATDPTTIWVRHHYNLVHLTLHSSADKSRVKLYNVPSVVICQLSKVSEYCLH